MENKRYRLEQITAGRAGDTVITQISIKYLESDRKADYVIETRNGSSEVFEVVNGGEFVKKEYNLSNGSASRAALELILSLNKQDPSKSGSVLREIATGLHFNQVKSKEN